MYADGYEWYALVTDLDLGPRAVSQLYRDRGDIRPRRRRRVA